MAIRNPDKIFRAFADRTRLRILHLLSRKGEICVCDLMKALGAGQSKVSRHLAYLQSAGMIEGRTQGRWSYYSLKKPKTKFQKSVVACLKDCFDDVPELKKDRHRMNAKGKREKCC